MSSSFREIRITDIVLPEYIRESGMDNYSITELADSISEHGIMQPPRVVAVEEEVGKFRLVFGLRRLQAAKVAGLEHIVCDVAHDDGYIKTAQQQLVENLHRVDISPLELAEQVVILSSYSKGLSQEDIGKMCNLSRERVNRLIQMDKLPRACRKYFVDNPSDEDRKPLREGHGAEIIRLLGKSEKEIADAIKKAYKEQMSVKQLRAYIGKLLGDGKSKNKKPDAYSTLPDSLKKAFMSMEDDFGGTLTLKINKDNEYSILIDAGDIEGLSDTFALMGYEAQDE